ncbi:MAG: hypothetical protein WCE68_10390 [Anaerolineales bacterium]
MQGQLRQEKLTVQIESECGHCHTPLHLRVDSDLNFHVQEAQAVPLLFVPMMNLRKLDDPSIIDAF